jgi:hypothetical protein
MKEDKIFAYKNFSDFKTAYFNRSLVVMEDMNRPN